VRALSRTAAADALIAATHPFAGHLRRHAQLEATAPRQAWSPADGPLPSLYLSHGAPMLFEMRSWMTELHTWARKLPTPKAILIVSAHWESAPLSLSAPDSPELVYDFGGFDPMYSRMRYETPDASELARQVRALLPDGEQVHQHRSRGLDHGAWVPLKVMYPEALSRGDVDELAHFRTRAPGMPYAHPTVEHFTPLFVTLGAATDPTAPVTTAVDGFALGLAKRSFQAA
jgi:4,5-DOPA dioxygenase extradiol